MCNVRESHFGDIPLESSMRDPKHVDQIIQTLSMLQGRALFTAIAKLPYPQKIQVMKELNI